MRLVQVLIPTGRERAVLDVLDDEGIDYALTDEDSGRGYTAVVTFPLPTNAVEPVLERLRAAGIERESYTVVLDAQTVRSRGFEALEAEYDEEENGDRIAREELVATARDLAPRVATFAVMTAVSAVVATAGLLLDSPAVVVGSMVIAPLIGPAMATAVGTVVDDTDLFKRGIALQFAGGLLAVACATLFALLLRFSGAVPLSPEEVFAISEVRERLAPDVLSLAVALGAGIAGALSLSSGVSSALVGVMIAAALVPPTAVVGIGLAWGDPTQVFGSVVLVLVNFLSINFAALAVLWYTGYRPEHWLALDEARSTTISRLALLGVGIVLLSGFLVGVTVDTAQTASFEEETRAAVVSEVESRGLTFISMDVEYEGVPLRRPSSVTVTVGHDPGFDPPPLADALAADVNRARPDQLLPGARPTVTVEVRYVEVERST